MPSKLALARKRRDERPGFLYGLKRMSGAGPAESGTTKAAQATAMAGGRQPRPEDSIWVAANRFLSAIGAGRIVAR
jgi:hypothetical protein